jgi:uncharacterized protein
MEEVGMYIALIGHGPNWVEGKSVYEQGQPVRDHLTSMRARYEEGSLLLGGPFDRGGGIAVLDVADEAAARTLMDADPGVVAGVMSYELHRLTAYFDAFHGFSATGSVDDLARLRSSSGGGR